MKVLVLVKTDKHIEDSPPRTNKKKKKSILTEVNVEENIHSHGNNCKDNNEKMSIFLELNVMKLPVLIKTDKNIEDSPPRTNNLKESSFLTEVNAEEKTHS